MSYQNRPLHGFLSDLWIVPSNDLKESSLLLLEQAESKYNNKMEAIRNIDAKEPIGLEMHLKRGEMRQKNTNRVSGNVPAASPIARGFEDRPDSSSMSPSQSSGVSY